MTYRQVKLTEAISLIRLGAKILNQIDSESEWEEVGEQLDECCSKLEGDYEREFGMSIAREGCNGRSM